MEEIDQFFSLLQVSCRVRPALARTEESACHRCAASRIASEWTHLFPYSYYRNCTLRSWGRSGVGLLCVVVRLRSAFKEGGRKGIEGMKGGCFFRRRKRRAKRIKKFGISKLYYYLSYDIELCKFLSQTQAVEKEGLCLKSAYINYFYLVSFIFVSWLQKFGNLNEFCQIDYLEQSYIRKYKNSFLSLIKIKMLVNLFSSLRYL